MELELKSLSDLPEVASAILKSTVGKRHFALFGPMGVGKTTLIKELCNQLNVKQVVTSPTFALINEYTTHSGERIFHFDFYRIKSMEELYDLGYEDYLYSDAYCFIEWPEKAEEIIPSHFVPIYLEEKASGVRYIKLMV